MSDRDVIHAYLKSLSKYLSRLEKAEAEDVIREVESHIYDARDAHEKDKGGISAAAILAGFGEPRELAARYVEHILTGAPPPKGFRTIQQVKKGATKGLYIMTELCGYGTSLILIIVGIYKAVVPEEVGVWATDSGDSFMLGVSSTPPGGTHELLGWWLVPILISLGLCAAFLTKKILAALKDKT